MKITIEGTVDSDVIGAGEQRTVEHTDYIRGLLRARLVRVVEWHHESPSDSGTKPDNDQVTDTETSTPVEEPAPPRRRRRAAAAGEK